MNIASPQSMLRRHMVMLGLTVASFTASGQAEAACTPTSPVNNTTVTCSGATTNQNGTDGYGSASDVGNTYNVLSGASVTGTGTGLRFQDHGTVNNSGTITGTGANEGGVFSATNGVVNNLGQISGTGANSDGVTSFSVGDVTNSGGINGVRFGVNVQNGQVTNTNTGTIVGGTDGVRIVDVAIA